MREEDRKDLFERMRTVTRHGCLFSPLFLRASVSPWSQYFDRDQLLL
jgi:hypothetical protein